MPPCSRMNAPAAASSSSVVTPGAKQPADVRDRLGDERARRGDLLDLARALADDHRLAATPSRASWIVGEDVVHRLLPVHDDLDARELVAVDHVLGELVVETEAVADRLRRVVGAPLLRRARAASRSVATSSETLQQDHGVERLADLVEHRVERLGLRDRAREPVEDERRPRRRAARG